MACCDRASGVVRLLDAILHPYLVTALMHNASAGVPETSLT